MRLSVRAAFVGMLSFCFASIYYLGVENIPYANGLASLELMKPYVYRQLVPVFVRLLVDMGVRVDWATTLLITGAGVGFYLALDELLEIFYRHDDRMKILTIALVLTCMVMFNEYRMPYDLFTAWFFTLAFLHIAEGDDRSYVILFPLICLNRETAFLLIAFYFAHALCVAVPNYRRLAWMTAYQVIVFMTITIGARLVFWDNVGLSAWIEPVQNIGKFINNPATTLLHLAVSIVLLMTIAQDWYMKPLFLRLALFCTLPPLMLMYIVFGQAFEVRVFWELSPILIAMILPTLWEYMPVLACFDFIE